MDNHDNVSGNNNIIQDHLSIAKTCNLFSPGDDNDDYNNYNNNYNNHSNNNNNISSSSSSSSSSVTFSGLSSVSNSYLNTRMTVVPTILNPCEST